MKIISGGQTGVDRAALDVALKHGIECGGWCPAGRLDELGRIPDKYPVVELAGGSFSDRTLQNVLDADATLIFFDRELRGGSEFTLRCCIEHSRPHLLIDSTHEHDGAANAIVDLTRKHKIDILNVAGPRQSEWPNGYEYASRVLDIFLLRIANT